MNLRPRIVQLINENEMITFTESVKITGDIGSHAQVIVYGNLVVDGIIHSGAGVFATGSAKISQANGPETSIQSNTLIKIVTVTGDVNLIAPIKYKGIQLSASGARQLDVHRPSTG